MQKCIIYERTVKTSYSLTGNNLETDVEDALQNHQITHTNGSGKTLKSIQHSGPDGEETK